MFTYLQHLLNVKSYTADVPYEQTISLMVWSQSGSTGSAGRKAVEADKEDFSREVASLPPSLSPSVSLSLALWRLSSQQADYQSLSREHFASAQFKAIFKPSLRITQM